MLYDYLHGILLVLMGLFAGYFIGKGRKKKV